MASNSSKTIVAKDIMTRRLVTLHPEQDVFEGIELLVKNKISGAPVVDENQKLLGVFSEKCCMQVLMDAAYEGLPTNQIGAFMDDDPHTITANTELLVMAQVFLLTTRRRLPVVTENGELLGQVSRRDVIQAASKMLSKPASNHNPLLYLSALHEMNDAPVK
ncbi:MAG: CBS domain-containing protein [Planctomycetota bacterium]